MTQTRTRNIFLALSCAALSACAGSSGGVVAPTNEAYVVQRSFANVGGGAMDTDKVFRTDGTTGGTTLVYAPTLTTEQSARIDGITTLGNFVYFNQSTETDGYLSPITAPIETLHKIDVGNNNITTQEPYFGNGTMFGGDIKTIELNGRLWNYNFQLNQQNPNNAHFDIELVTYNGQGGGTDASNLAIQQYMFGEGVVIGTKIYFPGKTGAVAFDTSGLTATPVPVTSGSSGFRLAKNGTDLYIFASNTGTMMGELYVKDTTSTNTPTFIGNMGISLMDGGAIPDVNGYLLFSQGGNLTAYNLNNNTPTTLDACVNVGLLHKRATDAYMICAPTSSSPNTIIRVDLSGATPTSQIVTTGTQSIIDRGKDHIVVGNTLFYNGSDNTGRGFWALDMTANAAVELASTATTSTVTGMTELNGNIIASVSGQLVVYNLTNGQLTPL